MPTDPSDPSTPKSSTRLYQTTSDAPSGGGGIFLVILLLLLAGGGAAYYFLIYKPAASAGATVLAPPTASGTPKPVVAATPPPATPAKTGYNTSERAKYIDQADQAFIALRNVTLEPYTLSRNALLSAGDFNAATLTTKDAIAARRGLVDQCLKANDDYEAFVKTQDATFKAELQKTPLNPGDVAEVVEGFSFKAQTDKNVQLRDLQRDALKAGDEILAFLDKSFGSWSINPAQHLVFKKPADAGPLNALNKTYNDKLTAMNKLLAEIKATADPATVATSAPGTSPAAASPVASPATSPVASASPAGSPAASPLASPAPGAKP